MRSLLFTVVVALAGTSAPAYAQTVTCADGTTSEAGRGACSHHGGIAKTRAPREAEPKRNTSARRDTDRRDSARRSTRDKEPSFINRCADGSISIAEGRGACSHHGGIADPQARTQRQPRRDTRRTDTRVDKPWWGDEGQREGEPMARCVDGTISYSRHHRGTCSNHGGVREWLDD
jgi:hypothetical protein